MMCLHFSYCVLCFLSFFFLFFFFFQAEDGIRDLTVTGVQTCALPIYYHIRGRAHGGRKLHRSSAGLPAVFRSSGVHGLNRSEERRVGKEGRSRWSPYH